MKITILMILYTVSSLISDDDEKDIIREITCATAMSHLQESSKFLLINKINVYFSINKF